MIFWSIIPLECVMEGFDEGESYARLEYIEWQGVTMLVERSAPGRARIHRLVSPRPNDYLRPEWAPGQWLSGVPDGPSDAKVW